MSITFIELRHENIIYTYKRFSRLCCMQKKMCKRSFINRIFSERGRKVIRQICDSMGVISHWKSAWKWKCKNLRKTSTVFMNVPKTVHVQLIYYLNYCSELCNSDSLSESLNEEEVSKLSKRICVVLSLTQIIRI